MIKSDEIKILSEKIKGYVEKTIKFLLLLKLMVKVMVMVNVCIFYLMPYFI